MSDEHEPRRWSAPNSDVPDELRAWLQASRAQAAAPAQLAELRQQLGRALGPEAGLVSAAPAAIAQLQLLGRVAALAGGLGTAALLGLWLSSTPPSADRTSPAGPEAARAAASLPAVAAPSAAAPVTAPAVTAPEAPDGASPSAAPPAPDARTPRRERTPAPASTPGEAELLRRAQAALAQRPREALRLTAEHQRRFTQPTLSEEREVIAIAALRSLGRQAAAKQREADFERRYRGSVHREKLRSSAE